MAKGKYNYRVEQQGDTWSVEITRRVTSRNVGVSKQKEGFETEADAEEWAQKELLGFLKNLDERNKRRTEEKEKTAERLKEKEIKNKARKKLKEAQAQVDEADESGDDE